MGKIMNSCWGFHYTSIRRVLQFFILFIIFACPTHPLAWLWGYVLMFAYSFYLLESQRNIKRQKQGETFLSCFCCFLHQMPTKSWAGYSAARKGELHLTLPHHCRNWNVWGMTCCFSGSLGGRQIRSGGRTQSDTPARDAGVSLTQRATTPML